MASVCAIVAGGQNSAHFFNVREICSYLYKRRMTASLCSEHRSINIINLHVTKRERGRDRAPESCGGHTRLCMLGAKICGAELDAMYSSAEVPATSTPPRMFYCARPGTSEPRSVAPRRVTSAP